MLSERKHFDALKMTAPLSSIEKSMYRYKSAQLALIVM